MDVLLGLEIGHALRDVFTHLQELDRCRVLRQAFPQVRQQAAVGKELSHYVNGFLLGAHAVQLDQVFMAKLPGLSKRRRKLSMRGLGFFHSYINHTSQWDTCAL